ncbi:MAG: DUF6883 domain-containing protein [Cyanobacteria bacterium P01_C01_bin.72]
MKLRDIATEIFIDSRKLTEYALNSNNPKGADKAVMFKNHLGFTKDELCTIKSILKQKYSASS